MTRKTDGSDRLKKVLSIEPQLGLVLFLISAPIILGLIAIALWTSNEWVQTILNPWRDPISTIIAMIYALWGVIEIRRALRGLPDPDSDGYIRRGD